MDSSTGSDLIKAWEDGDLTNLEALPFLGSLTDSPFKIGWAHLVSAFPKIGKTELIHALCMEWLDEHGVAYFTEEDKTTWAKRLLSFKYKPLEKITYYHALGEGQDSVMELLAETEADIVIIDTARLLGIKDENDNSEVHNRLAPVIQFIKANAKTLIVVHHRNKRDEVNQGLEISGAHAFLAIVDVGLIITKANKNEQRREIKGYGRIEPVEELIYERLDTGETKLVGHKDEFQLSAVKNRILNEAVDGSWITTADILASLNPPPSLRQIQSALRELADEGAVERDPDISVELVKGKTLKWKKTTVVSTTKEQEEDDDSNS